MNKTIPWDTNETGGIGPYSADEYIELIRAFHGFPAPGLIIGGFMVQAARRRITADVLFNAVCETSRCLPDVIQLLTPCTVGNGWLRIYSLDIYALSLYDKETGRGVRVSVDPKKLANYPETEAWFLKKKPKKEQDSQKLRQEMIAAGEDPLSVTSVIVDPRHLVRRKKGDMVVCPLCGDVYPAADGAVCRGCRGESPYLAAPSTSVPAAKDEGPELLSVPVVDAVGKKIVHDMTRIVPDVSKGPAFVRDQVISSGDVCRLQSMGRRTVYVSGGKDPGPEWVHEDEAAEAFARGMAGDGTETGGPPSEGKVNIRARQKGLFIADVDRLEAFNLVPNVMAASRRSFGVVREGSTVAGTRAIPLYLAREHFERALSVLESGPIFSVLPLRRARVGVLVTGTEIVQGLIEDRFEPVVRTKVVEYGSDVAAVRIVPDEREAVAEGVGEMIREGCDLIITTAGLSVDPDDVTRKGLQDAGLTDDMYGIPVLPGAMSLVGMIGDVEVLGVPACALFYKTTAFDLLLPRVLAGLRITRADLAGLSHGGLCHNCKFCTYPKCSFGA